MRSIKVFFLTTIVSISFYTSSFELNENIEIQADKVELSKNENKIYFKNNVQILSNNIEIIADSASYDNEKNILTLLGAPSHIKSIKEELFFRGQAEKILFFNNEEVHLIKNANMKYDKISVSSNMIIFNPITGKISSEWGIKMLKVRELLKSIKDKRIVNNVSFDVNFGSIFGLLGPNGAGKTSTFYMIAGLIKPDSGKVLLSGEDISNIPIHSRSKLGIKYLPQEPSIFKDLTVYENLYGLAELSFTNKKSINNFIESSMDEFSLSSISSLKGRQLSGGQRRKVEIARTLAADPKIILLDEPFAGIDPIAIEDIKDVLNKLILKNIGILITDHNVRETLEICDQAAILNNGEIIAKGEKDYLINDNEVNKVYLGNIYS